MSKALAFGCLGIVLLVLVVGGFMLAGSYNTLNRLGQAVDAQWAQVENVYQRRADLIPNLVRTVQGAANFERSTLEAVVNARAGVGQMKVDSSITNDPQAMARFEQAQGALTSALSRLLVVVERYPELKANANFRDLQAQLEGTENRISVERGRFNERAQEYNTQRRSFPTVLVAGLLRFAEKAYFRAQPGAERAPDVQFNFGTPPAGAAPPVPSPAP
jgi:LemA protein